MRIPKLNTRADLATNRIMVNSATFCWNIATLQRISAEFGCDRSNEKDATINRGVEQNLDHNIVRQLVGRKFIVDMLGRELPTFLGGFSQEVVDIAQNLVPDSSNEPFVEDLIGPAKEATRYKLLLKAILGSCKIVYTNQNDDNLIVFEVVDGTNQNGVTTAMFRGGAMGEDLWCTFTEITNFKLSNLEAQ